MDLAHVTEDQAPEEEQFTGPLTERLTHKNFKARKAAYEELLELYAAPTPPAEQDFSGFFKKMASDVNVIAQESALDFFLVYFDRFEGAPDHASAVQPVVADKCLGANKSGLAKKAQDLLQLIAEVTTPEALVPDLLKLFRHKTPKVRLAAVQCAVEAVRNFGLRVPVKEFLKKDGLLVLFTDSDGKVRKEAQALTVEIYKYLRDALKALPFFQELRDTQKGELEKSFAEVPAEIPRPARGLRGEAKAGGEAAAGAGAPPTVDLDGLIEAQPVLSKLPKNFMEVVGGTGKWQDRKDMLEHLVTLTQGKRLQPDDYLETVKLLKRLLNDSNIPLVALAIKILGQFAAGLQAAFATYTRFYFSTLLDKFKEKKVTVLEPLQSTMELLHVHGCVGVADFAEDIAAGITHKVPQVREQTLRWLLKCLQRSDRPTLQRAFKPLAGAMGKACDDSCGPVRDAALQTLAVVQAILGEQAVAPLVARLDKKLQEKFRAAVPESAPAASTPTAAAAPPPPLRRVDSQRGAAAPQKRAHESPSQASEDGAPPLKRAASLKLNGARPPRKLALGASVGKPASAPSDAEALRPFPALSAAEADEAAGAVVPAAVLAGLGSAQFKERDEAMAAALQSLEDLSSEALAQSAEVWVRLLGAKPGWREPHFQVLNKMFQLLTTLAQRASAFPPRSAAHVVPLVGEKLGDPKQRAGGRALLTQLAEAVGLRLVVLGLLPALADSKAPKAAAEVLDWIAAAVEDFGCGALDVPGLVTALKGPLDKPQPVVKAAAVRVLVALRKAHGPRVRDLLQGLKPQLLATIDEQFAQVVALPGFQPKRQAPGEPAAPTPRVDIGGQVTPALLAQMAHADWKTRQAALVQAERLVEGAQRRITPAVGPLVGACRARLLDSNKNLVVQTLNLLGLVAQAVGPPMRAHLKACMDGILHCLAESKPPVRVAARSTLTALEAEVGLEPLLPFLPKAFDLVAARPDLTQWVALTLTSRVAGLPPGVLVPLVRPVIACLQDRSADVRKSAEAVLGPLLRNVGHEAVGKEMRDLKPAVAKSLQGVLDRQRGQGGVLTAPPPPPSPLALPIGTVSIADEEKENDGRRLNLPPPPATVFKALAALNGGLKPEPEPQDVTMADAEPSLPPPPPMFAAPLPLAAVVAAPPMAPPGPCPMAESGPCPMEQVPDMRQMLPRSAVVFEEPAPPSEPPLDLQLDAQLAPGSFRRPPPPGPRRVPIPSTEARPGSAPGAGRAEVGVGPVAAGPLLERVLGGTNAQCIDALKSLLEAFVTHEPFVPYDVNQLLEVVLQRVAKVFDTEPLNVREAKFLLTTLQGVFTQPISARQVSGALLQRTITAALGQLRGDHLRTLQGGEFLLKAFNTVMLRLLEHGDQALVFGAVVGRLQEAYAQWKAYKSDDNERLMELLAKCLLKSLRIVLTSPPADFVPLLSAVDQFLVASPPSAFRPPEDLPLRTVKTCLTELTRHLGPAARAALPPGCSPVTANFVTAVLQKMGHAPAMPPPPIRVPTTAAAVAPPNAASGPGGPELPLAGRLDEIFTRIRDRERTLEAIQDLHGLITAHPTVDIEPWLSKTSYPFQCYIKRQLSQIHAQHAATGAAGPRGPAAPPPAVSLDGVRQRLQQQAHLAAPSGAGEAVGGGATDVSAQFESIRQRMQYMRPAPHPAEGLA